ncbi:MAG: hypothetical protein IKG93_04035 [Clostridiales bacterium]|nr:hypothetical protein [Clostridiales bacterium]
MKTCRFCQNVQESGDFCDACGQPFPADKLDFSNSDDLFAGMGLPVSAENTSTDLTGAVPTVSDEVASTPNDPSAEAQNEEAPSAEENPSSQDESEDKTSDKDSETDSDDEELEPEEDTPHKKIMYSAREAGESVYQKKRHFITASPTTSSKTSSPAPKANTNTNATAAAASYKGNTYSSEYTFALVSLILNSVGFLFTCGTGLFSLAISIFAFIKASGLKNGKAADPASTARTVKILDVIADFLIVIWVAVLAIAILSEL